jgi:tripartite ATP-independent transporter DctP family solute receptor
MKKKRNLFTALTVSAMLLLAACGGEESLGNSGNANDGNNDGGNNAGNNAESGGEAYKLNINTALAESDPIYQGLVEFKENVEERTDGEVIIEIFGSGSLGEDSDLIEQARVGANVAVVSDTGRLAEMVPEMGILSAPYIAESFDEAAQIVDSDLFKEWEEELAADHNLRILSFNWYQGDRHLLTNKKIESIEDLKGLQLRTTGSPIWLETVRAMGASPAGMAWTEVYPGIQQGVIDGAEAQLPAVFGANLHEVVDYITKTGHFQLLTGIVAGEQWMSDLPEEYQEIIFEEASKAGAGASEQTLELLEDFEQQLVDEGVEVNEIDIAPFVEATEVVYDEFDFEELREEIHQILGK